MTRSDTIAQVRSPPGTLTSPGDSETEAFPAEFLRCLRDRGLTGVQLAISGAHRGLVNAIATVFQSSAWQRCRVHLTGNVLDRVSKAHDEMVAATIRTIVAQPGQAEVRTQVDLVATLLTGRFPAVAATAFDAEPDGVRGPPPRLLAHDLVHQPGRAPPPRGQDINRRRRDLPQCRRPALAVRVQTHRAP